MQICRSRISPLCKNLSFTRRCDFRSFSSAVASIERTEADHARDEESPTFSLRKGFADGEGINCDASTSQRTTKRRRSSPSSNLQSTLRKYSALKKKESLHSSNTRLQQHGQDEGGLKPSVVGALESDASVSRIQLQDVITAYIDSLKKQFDTTSGQDTTPVQNELDLEPQRSFRTGKAASFLAENRLTWDDVRVWCDILTNDNDIEAAKELIARESPKAILLVFLSRERLSAEALRYLLEYASTLTRSLSSPESDPGSRNDFSSMMILVIRLYRHARIVLPQALTSITKVFITLLPSRASIGNSRKPRVLNHIGRFCNRVLKLLSLPTSAHPYHSAYIMQEAQFDLIGFMAKQNPPIAINREGFRAISQVQLACKKRARELDWASLKTASWPPWKEDRTGLDTEKGPEYGVSRALEAIHKAREAGYGSRAWERVATVLAGFDNDLSPTIQTRAFLPFKFRNQISFLTMLWCARIRATRNVREAWSGFLAYREEIKGRHTPDQLVYLAMFQKLHEQFRLENDVAKHSQRQSHGGDAREILPVSESPKEQTYVRTPPPSMDELADQMYAIGITPVDNCLNFLVANAHSAAEGLKYLDWASETHPELNALLYPTTEANPELDNVSKETFSAYIHFLCRFDAVSRILRYRSQAHGRAYQRIQRYPAAFVAYHLLRSRPNNTHSAWYSVASRMMTTRLPEELLTSFSENPDVLAMERWQFVRSVIDQMCRQDRLNIDAKIFILLNRAMTPAIRAAQNVKTQAEVEDGQKKTNAEPAWKRAPRALGETLLTSKKGSRVDRARTDRGAVTVAERLLSDGASYLGSKFIELFGGQTALSSQRLGLSEEEQSNEIPSVPALLATPYPSILHAYVHSLGLLGAYSEIKRLAGWLVQHQQAVSDASQIPANGTEMQRKLLVAMRVFLERSWLLDQNVDDENMENGTSATVPRSEPRASLAAPQDNIDAVRLKIYGLSDDFGGWPTDAEVYEYCFGKKAGDFPPR